MSVSSGPPELPPDSPGSAVSSRLQNEYNDLLQRAVVLTNHGSTTIAAMNPLLLGSGQRMTTKKTAPVINLTGFHSPETDRTDSPRSEAETQREQLSRIPSLNQLLSMAALPSNEPTNGTHSFIPQDSDEAIAHHLVRYSELVSNDLESKPITEKMDHWYLDLKKNLMTEFDKLRLQFLEEAQQHALREKQAQAKEYVRLNQDIKTMREMLTHYEQTIDQKDRTEKNLTRALDMLYQKNTASRHYYEWRLVHIEQRRQQYSFALAKRFYEDKIKRKAMISWKTTTEVGWKKRFELACEKKAKDVLVELGNEYELKYKQLELQLLNANEEIARLKVDKGDQDENVKKAFMRGVCALNMEAMSVLLKNQNESETTPFVTEEQKRAFEHLRHQQSSEQFADEQVPVSGTSTSGDEENYPTSACRHPQTLSTHVYKECLPSTIYRTGEARPVPQSNNINFRSRKVTFQKHPSTTRNPTRPASNTSVFVERHAPTSHIRS